MTFRVGQRIVCVKEVPHRVWPDCAYPRFHEVYTIRALRVCPRSQTLNCQLVEIVNPERESPPDGFGEPYFGIWRFRPIVENKTDISFAHEILRKASRKETVRA
jgi:hypothetical protein